MATNSLTLSLDDSAKSLTPDQLSASSLLKIVSLLEAAFTEASDKPDDEHSPAISLVGVDDGGSIRNMLMVGSWAKAGAVAVLGAIHSGDFSGIPSESHRKLHELSQYVTGHEFTAKITGLSKSVKISGTKPIPELQLSLIKSRTTIYGQVRSVGGDKPSASIRLFSTSKPLKVSLSEELAIELGKRLYDYIGISGEASINVPTGEYVSFRAMSILPYKGKKANPLGAIDMLDKELSGAWNGLDVDSFVAGMRGREERA